MTNDMNRNSPTRMLIMIIIVIFIKNAGNREKYHLLLQHENMAIMTHEALAFQFLFQQSWLNLIVTNCLLFYIFLNLISCHKLLLI